VATGANVEYLPASLQRAAAAANRLEVYRKRAGLPRLDLIS